VSIGRQSDIGRRCYCAGQPPDPWPEATASIPSSANIRSPSIIKRSRVALPLAFPRPTRMRSVELVPGSNAPVLDIAVGAVPVTIRIVPRVSMLSGRTPAPACAVVTFSGAKVAGSGTGASGLGGVPSESLQQLPAQQSRQTPENTRDGPALSRAGGRARSPTIGAHAPLS
jgi:hypothetical protein